MIGLNHKPRASALIFPAMLATFLFFFSAPAAHAQTADITMTFESTKPTLMLAGSGTVAVFLGAGEAQTITLDPKGAIFTSVSDLPAGLKTMRIITVNGGITMLSILDIGLTSLDLSGATALVSVTCARNQLSADSINAMFGTLHSNSEILDSNGTRQIYCFDNPGSHLSVDKSIAEARGWEVTN